MVVILLDEQDDVEIKGPLSSTTDSPSRTPLPDLDNSEDESSSELEEQQPFIQPPQDIPPSYADVQLFQRRRQAADDAKDAGYTLRAKRRFLRAFIAALLLCSFPLTISLFFYKYHHRPQNSDPSPAGPLPPRPPFNRPDSGRDRFYPPPPWRRPGPGLEDDGHRYPFPPPRWGPPPPWDDHPEDGRRRFPDESRPWHGYPPPNEGEGEVDCSSPWTPESQGNLLDSKATDLSYSKIYTLDLSTAIFIRSFLPNATGSLRVSLDKDVPVGKAIVKVTTNDIPKHQLKDFQACILHQDNNAQGLRLKSMGYYPKEASFSITLKFSFLDTTYPGLDTYLPRFSQSFDDFKTREFRYIELGGANSPIEAIALSARYLHVHNSNATIDGVFLARRKLDISGSSRAITLTAYICNNGQNYPTRARIVSSQAPIEAKLVICQLDLESLEQDGRYNVHVENESAPVSLQLEHQSAQHGSPSSLQLNMTTTASSASLTVDTGFGGFFTVIGDEVPARVVHEEAKDTQGGVRYMELDGNSGDKMARGKVFWNSPAPPLDRPSSEVRVSTTGAGEASLVVLGD